MQLSCVSTPVRTDAQGQCATKHSLEDVRRSLLANDATSAYEELDLLDHYDRGSMWITGWLRLAAQQLRSDGHLDERTIAVLQFEILPNCPPTSLPSGVHR